MARREQAGRALSDQALGEPGQLSGESAVGGEKRRFAPDATSDRVYKKPALTPYFGAPPRRARAPSSADRAATPNPPRIC